MLSWHVSRFGHGLTYDPHTADMARDRSSNAGRSLTRRNESAYRCHGPEPRRLGGQLVGLPGITEQRFDLLDFYVSSQSTEPTLVSGDSALVGFFCDMAPSRPTLATSLCSAFRPTTRRQAWTISSSASPWPVTSQTTFIFGRMAGCAGTMGGTRRAISAESTRSYDTLKTSTAAKTDSLRMARPRRTRCFCNDWCRLGPLAAIRTGIVISSLAVYRDIVRHDIAVFPSSTVRVDGVRVYRREWQACELAALASGGTRSIRGSTHWCPSYLARR